MKRALIIRLCIVCTIAAVAVTGTSAQFPFWQKRLDSEGEAVGINPINPNTIYAQRSDNGLMVSHDRGKTWALVSYNVPFQIREIIVHPNDTLTIFVVAFFNDLQRSTDGGTTWTDVLSSFGIDGESVTYDPVHPDTMYAGNFADGSVYRSVNRGATWTFRGSVGSNLCGLAVRPDSANILYAGAGSGRIAKSTNGGISWYQVKPTGASETPRIVVNPVNPQIAYATGFGGNPSFTGVWKTTNGGESWFLTPLQNINMWSLEIDNSNPSTIWSGTFDEYNAGVYRSTDAGASWQFYGRGFFPYNSMWNLHLDPKNDSNLYVAATSGDFGNDGIYKFSTANAGVTGFVRDSLTNSIIANGIIHFSPSGDSLNLATTNGAYSFYRLNTDTTTKVNISIYIRSVLFKQQIISLVTDSILSQDILVRPGSVQGTVFNDLNHNGSMDGGESGTSGWVLLLNGPTFAAETSDVNGHFIFNDLFPGTYTLTEQHKKGFTQSDPPGSSYIITVDGNTRDFAGKDFGNYADHVVLAVTPTPYSHLNSRTVTVQATFDTSMDISFFNDTSSWIVSGKWSGRHRGTFDFNAGHTTATFTPALPFQYGEVVTVDITNKLRSAAGGVLFPYTFQFNVAAHSGPAIFYGKANYHVGHFPTSIAAGDLNGDGRNDIVVVNTNSNTVSVLMNSGFGTFLPKADYNVGVTPQEVLLSDVDNDGNLDIVAANSAGGTISILKNNGDGTFASKIDYSAGIPALGVAVADMDGDGYPDLVVGGTTSTTLSVLLNDKTGAFPTHTAYPGVSAPWSVLTGDIDGDGTADVAALNAGVPSTVSLLSNGGGGELSPFPSAPTVGNNAHYGALADINGDNKVDIIVANSGSNTFSLLTMQDSTFNPKIDFNTGNSPWSLATGDIEGDSLVDIVVTNLASNTISIFKNLGNGNFTRTDHSTLSTPHGVVVADLDNDGDMDIVVANSGSDSISVYINSSITPETHTAGWNLLSLPVLPSNLLKASLYPSALSDAFVYKGSYVSADTLAFGRGFWIKFSSADTNLIQGENVTSDSVGLVSNWNIIGGVSAPVSVGSITTTPGGIISSSFFGYNGGYTLADTLYPGQGYWVKATTAGAMFLSSSGNYPGQTTSHSSLASVSHTIDFSDAALRHQTLYVAETNEEMKNRDFFISPPPPPSTGFDVRFASQRILEAVGSNTSVNLPVVLSGIQYPVTITWNMKDQAGYRWSLQEDGYSQALTGEGKLILTRQPTGGLSILGSPSIRMVPDHYSLEQNYPNPFNPVTTVRYDIPERAVVTLRIYNVLGEEVITLADGLQEAGFKSVVWNGVDRNGREIPSGVYYARLQAQGMTVTSPSFVQVQKMLLIK